MGKVRDIIDKTFEYGQGRGELPGVDELAEAIEVLSDSENPQSSQDDLTDFEYLKRIAYDLAHQRFGNRIYIRGLIEFTNICKNDCYYCGIRKSNSHVDRYRLTRIRFWLAPMKDMYWDFAHLCFREARTEAFRMGL